MPPFTTGIMEAPEEPEEDAADEQSLSDERSTPYFTEFCSARSLRKANSFRPVTPSGGRWGEDKIRTLMSLNEEN